MIINKVVDLDNECKCSQILVVGDESFSHIPIKQVCRQLFDIKNVDKANDAQHAVNFFTDRLSRKCCDTRYQLVICDYEM